MTPYLKLENVSFSYNNIKILNKVSFSVFSGDYMAIVGHNGSGKSTLLKLMLGLLEPENGNISRFDMLDYRWKSGDIGYIPQTGLTKYTTFPATVLEVVLLPFESKSFFSFSKETYKKKAIYSLTQVGMEAYINESIQNLSGGQLQRVLIAKELVNSPKILFLDEPTNGLDQASIKELYALLNELNGKGMTIILVTHHLDNLESSINRIIEVDHQKIKEEDYVTI